MKPSAWALLAVLLVTPAASADAAPSSERVYVASVGAHVAVSESLDWTGVTNATYVPVAHFHAPPAIANLSITVLTAGGAPVPVAFSAIQKTPSGDVDTYRIDLRGIQPSAPASGAYEVTATYDASAASVRLRTYYAAPRFTLLAQLRPGEDVGSDLVGGFVPTGTGLYHASRTDVPANTTYTVSVVKTAAPSASANGRYLWALGGVVVGLVLAWISVRAGWMGGAKGTKFEKGGAAEPRTMLEARRRTLLAALKELEVAHEAKEIPDDAYAPLKEEYKAQAVRVMRNLDEKGER